MHVDRTRFLMITSALAAACARSPGVASGGTPPPAELGQASGSAGVVEVPEPASTEVEDEQVPVASSGCDDMHGRPPSCRDMRLPGPTCEQGMNVPPNVCEAIARVAKPRVAEALMSCLVEHSKQGGRCGPDDWTGDCATRALESLCNVDHGFDRQCSEIESRCSRYRYRGAIPFRSEQCVRLLSAVLPSEQAAALSCVSEGCGIEHCFVSLAYGKIW
jgi:hypothetical protein